MTTTNTALISPWRALGALAVALLLFLGSTGTALAHGSSGHESNQHGQALGRMAPGLGAELAQVRAATARYHDVQVAIDDGYVEVSDCVEHPTLGAMGYHYVNSSLVGLEPTQPQALLYIPQRDGHLRLVAVEYVHPDGGELFEQPFLHGSPLGDNTALHVWVWQANPSGMFTPFNPALSCPAD